MQAINASVARHVVSLASPSPHPTALASDDAGSERPRPASATTKTVSQPFLSRFSRPQAKARASTHPRGAKRARAPRGARASLRIARPSLAWVRADADADADADALTLTLTLRMHGCMDARARDSPWRSSSTVTSPKNLKPLTWALPPGQMTGPNDSRRVCDRAAGDDAGHALDAVQGRSPARMVSLPTTVLRRGLDRRQSRHEKGGREHAGGAGAIR